ncbi:MAG: M24 family metallopeptidase, partial [Vicinamibacteria bacterium]
MPKPLAFALTLLFSAPALAQDQVPVILSMRERAETIDRWLEIRFETVLPRLMRKENVDMWVIIAREYNEDPVIETMLPATWLAARRRTILVFFDRGEAAGVERLAVARYDVGKAIQGTWNPEEVPDQWERLRQVIEERDPKAIALNRSKTFALADGLTDAELDSFLEALPDKYEERIVSGERLAIGWLETRTAEEMQVYPGIVKIARSIIAEGLSERVIQPGATTTTDVEWWYRDRIAELTLDTWFHPSVSVQRAEAPGHGEGFASRPEEQTILPGDLLHVDFGITYLRLNTDTQMHAYVLRPGEKDAPAGLREALSTGNRLQDILTSQFASGRTGNEILKAALEQAKREGIRPSIYTHPIGFHGHAAGPTIGLWDRQEGVPGA